MNVQQKKTRNKPSDDHLALEQQLEQSSHRHPRTHPHEDEDYIPSRKQPSPLPQTALARHSRSTSSSQEHTGQEYRGDTAAHHSHGGHEAQRSSRESMATDAAEAFHHSRRAPFQSRYETYETDRVSKHSRSNEDSASSETTPRKGHSFEDPMMSNSRTRSEEASRRRRLERSIDRQGYYREATGLPHGIRPSEEDEVVVVTERYVYRPRPLSHVQEEDLKNRKQDIVDKATLRDGKSYQQFAAEAEASSYYHNNWSGVSEQAKSSRERVRPRDLEGLIAPADSHTSETSSSSRYEGEPFFI
jgi:hypothetical protein